MRQPSIHLFFLSFLLPTLCHAADGFGPQAKWLCEAFSRAEAISNEEFAARLDPGFLAMATPEALRGYFSQTAKALGQCTATERQTLLPNTKGVTLRTYFFQMAGGKRLIISFDLKQTPAGDRISQLALGTVEAEQGVIEAKQNYLVEAVKVPSSDGVPLQTVVFRKNDQKKRPVVVLRTPYFRTNGQFQYAHYYATADYYLNLGYHFVLQAVRGTGGSGDEFKFFNPQEIQDGDATIRWVNAQSFCDGAIAIVGVSYDGLTALAAGVNNPPGLKLIMAGGSPVDAANGPFIRNGLVLSSQLDYLRYNITQNGMPKDPKAVEYALLHRALHEPNLGQYDELAFGQVLKDWRELANHFGSAEDPFWKTRQFFDQIHKINVPTYHIAGTRADGDMIDVLNNFREVSEHSAFPGRHRLILGYWDHGNSIPYDDGRNAGEFIRERYPALLAYHLRGTDTPYAHEPRVQVASNLGASFYGSEEFPLRGFRENTLYFRSAGGKLRLENRVSENESENSSYLFLPEEPNLLEKMDPRQNLVFRYQAPQDLPMLGNLNFDLYVRIEGYLGPRLEQVDLLVQTGVIKQDGKIVPLSACLTGKKVHAREADASGVIRVQTQNCHVMHDLRQGESLVVQITSNGFPVLLRNTGNSPEQYYEPFRTGKITLLHNKQFPSRMNFQTEINSR